MIETDKHYYHIVLICFYLCYIITYILKFIAILVICGIIILDFNNYERSDIMNENINNSEFIENTPELETAVASATEDSAYANRNSISRYKMREQAVLLVFERLFSDTDLDEIADNLIDSRDIYLSDYAINLAKEIEDNQGEIDAFISNNLSSGWKISRISRISLAILRVAVYEMKFVSEVPVSVAINEAVELTKKYSTDDAPFVNGVLGAIAKEIE